jgi:hypothetical protein
MQTPAEPSSRRPLLVWLISIYFFLSSSWTMFSLFLIQTGTVPLSSAQKAYLANLNGADYLLLIIGALLGLSAAVALFLMRKAAYYLFGATLAFNMAFTIWHLIGRHWLSVIGAGGLAAAAVGWLVLFAICVYTARLTARGTLK